MTGLAWEVCACSARDVLSLHDQASAASQQVLPLHQRLPASAWAAHQQSPSMHCC